jgi:hypothetical protein
VSASGHSVVIHPGLVKTATSTLQKHVFRHHPGIRFLGLPAPTPELEWALRHICQADSIDYEPDRLKAVLDAATAETEPPRTALLSYENFALHESKDKGMVAERLHALFPEARIVFTIRRQEDLVVSWYLTKLRTLIKRKAYVPFAEWYWVGGREPHRTIIDDLRYGRMIQYYGNLFGRERVHVLLFEQLRRDPEAYAQAFARILGVDGATFHRLMAGKRENAAMSQRHLLFWRRFGHLLPRKLVRDWARSDALRRGAPARVEVPEKVRQHIRELCADDNAELARTFGLDLAGNGYALPDAP